MKGLEIKEGKLSAGVDADSDGAKSVNVELSLSEALSEVFIKGEAKAEAKVVNFKLEGTKLVINVDTDKDSESLLKIEVDLVESFDEVSKAVIKKD